MGTVTKTIGTGGSRDYSTLQSWEDALPANLVTDGNAQVGECYNDGEFTSAAAQLTISGQTTDATNFITLKTASGQSFKDHANKLTNRLIYNQSNGVGIRSTNGYITAVTVITGRTVLQGLQINASASTSMGLTLGGSNQKVEQCIIHGGTGSNANCSGTNTLNNVLFVNNAAAGGNNAGIRMQTGTFNLKNVTSVRYSNLAAGIRSFRGDYATVNMQNCSGFGFSAFHQSVSSSFSGNNNCSDQAISFGTSNQASKTYSDQFEQPSNSGGVPDYRTKSGSDQIDNGDDESGTFTVDIVGVTRPIGSAWDIGVWELASSGKEGETIATLAAITSAMEGTRTRLGSTVATLADITSNMAGTRTRVGETQATLADIVAVMSGTRGRIGVLDSTLGPIISNLEGTGGSGGPAAGNGSIYPGYRRRRGRG